MQQYPIGPDRRFVKYGPFDSVLLVLYVLVLLSLAIFWTGLKQYLWQKSFIAHAVTAPGVIVSVEQRWADHGSLYRPTVQFTPNNGTTPITFTSRMSSSKYIEKGEAITVYYQPDSPTNAETEAVASSPVVAYAFLFTGGLLLLLFGAGIRKSLVGYEVPISSSSE